MARECSAFAVRKHSSPNSAGNGTTNASSLIARELAKHSQNKAKIGEQRHFAPATQPDVDSSE